MVKKIRTRIWVRIPGRGCYRKYRAGCNRQWGKFQNSWSLVNRKEKHLFWSPWAAHRIDLMFKDIGSMKLVKEILDSAKMITSFIYNSLKVVNLIKQFTRDRDLLRPGITRFAICHRVHCYWKPYSLWAGFEENVYNNRMTWVQQGKGQKNYEK